MAQLFLLFRIDVLQFASFPLFSDSVSPSAALEIGEAKDSPTLREVDLLGTKLCLLDTGGVRLEKPGFVDDGEVFSDESINGERMEGVCGCSSFESKRGEGEDAVKYAMEDCRLAALVCFSAKLLSNGETGVELSSEVTFLDV